MPFDSTEFQTIAGQPVCAICSRTEGLAVPGRSSGIANGSSSSAEPEVSKESLTSFSPNTLHPCPSCLISQACHLHAEQHRTLHQTTDRLTCSSFARIASVDRLRDRHFSRPEAQPHEGPPVYIQPSVVPQYVGLPAEPSPLLDDPRADPDHKVTTRGGDIMHFFGASWENYFTFRKFPPFEPDFLAWISVPLSMVLTAFDALEETIGREKLGEMEELTLEIVGADSNELTMRLAFEELLHLLPRLRCLLVRLIGPGLAAVELPSPHTKPQPEVTCPACDKRNVERSFSLHATDYAEYRSMTTRDKSWRRADLVVAYNSGLAAPEHTRSWKSAVEAIRDWNIPAVFTAYNRDEILRDTQVLEKWGCKIVGGGPRKNRWLSLDVKYDPSGESADEGWGNGFYVTNAFVVWWKGKV
ncbi:hypothetical protein HDU93_000437 [Gonapodya sp. JEL0774]|nr:hypothetical protein HDU93_000437 [Gonapodya sp. JEL0774]